ncbi:MAG: shikimate dehydrogenase [Nanoarchaeota archaeon]|nr:shikimate dehydrogenase [Nanoarchaeota archaeon]
MLEAQIRKLIEESKHHVVTGLIGENPTTYSKSRIMWNVVFIYHGIDSEYIPFDVASDKLEGVLDLLLNYSKLLGFNITNPYKERTAQHPSILVDDLARVIGGVNTVHKFEDNIQGHSTDGYGAIRSIQGQSGEDVISGNNIMVLGAGGSGSAIALACAEEGGAVRVANRTFEKARDLSERAEQYGKKIFPLSLYSEKTGYSEEFMKSLKETDIVINTLPTEKKTGRPLFMGEELSGKEKICMDIVYGHRSHFLETARKNGHLCIDGRWMLLHQAVKAFEYIYQSEIHKKGLSTKEITGPMRYAITHFEFDTPNELIERRINDARGEIESSLD